MGSAAIYLLQDEPEKLEKLLIRICNSLRDYYLEGFTADGVCPEGLGYFTYGMTYFVGFADQLYDFTAGKMDLFSEEKLEKIARFQAKCYFQSGKTVCFSDGFTEDTFKVGLTCYLAMKYPGAAIPPMKQAGGLFDDHCYRFMGLYRNLTWTKRYMEMLAASCEGEEGRADTAADFMTNTAADSMANTAVDSLENTGFDVPCQITFPDAQWTICQSKNGAGLGAKGGHNAEPHNHNDIGCFFYLSGEDFLLADFGCGEYTKEYFAEGRYGYFCCRSLGHSVPLIDGKEQLPGEAYRCDRFETDGNGKTIISFGQAYGNPGLHSLVRTLDWNRENGSLKVEDVFETADEIKSVTENLVTGWKPQIQGNTILIQGSKRSCLITVEGPETEIICASEDFPDHDGIHRQVWRIQWQVSVNTEHCMADTKAAGYRRLQACFTVEAL